MPTPSRPLAFARLLRLPNVVTAVADVAMAGAVTGAIAGPPAGFAAVLLASACLYLAGMALNDVFDRADDAKSRPFRPLPAGHIAVRTAAGLGAGLLAAGVGLAAVARADGNPLYADSLAIAVALAAAVVGYDGYLKRTPFGPVGMGLCRSLNVLLGLSVGPADAVPPELRLHLAATVGVYIAGVTWFARTEEQRSRPRHLRSAVAVMLAAAGLAVTVPAHRPPGATPWYFPYLLVAAGFAVGGPAAEAVRRPGPKEVQAAVKRAIFGLVALDAVLAAAFVGWPGLLLLLLLPPAVVVGKWVYST